MNFSVKIWSHVPHSPMVYIKMAQFSRAKSCVCTCFLGQFSSCPASVAELLLLLFRLNGLNGPALARVIIGKQALQVPSRVIEGFIFINYHK